ncbi:MAG TPA: sarcosine oxidase subunit delta [Actinomycetes bacterium]|nr:sarcosine oxidase subunit delta [Actinomycetes bacterium]
MILLPCPWCGPRNVAEFRYAGERVPRPDPAAASAEAWRAYLYLRANPAGWTTEHWFHRAGCRRYLTVERHTVTNAVRSARPPAGADGEPNPGGEARDPGEAPDRGGEAP